MALSFEKKVFDCGPPLAKTYKFAILRQKHESRAMMAGRILLLLLAGACLGGAFASARSALRSPVPGLYADRDAQYLGNMQQEEEKPTSFMLINETGRQIELTRVVPSCTCALTDLPATSLKSASRVRLDAKMRSGLNRGDILSTIDVYYRFADENDLRKLTLMLRATVIPDYRVEPSELFFDSKSPDSQTITVTSALPDFRLTKAYSTNAAFKVTKPEGGGAKHSILVSLNKEHVGAHPINAQLVLGTENTKQKELYLKLRFVPE